MESASLRALIRQKLVDGRLPQSSIPRVWGGRSPAEECDACEEKMGSNHFVKECVSMDASKRPLQFHVECVYMWDQERSAPGR